ncbi:MAG TPA: LysR family transcriptional regulator [Trebonia sp.]|jgi:DNA-binding transcriptional LysR family regulator|nr:LysR family transcriptional regulator [Trebonia sp.]
MHDDVAALDALVPRLRQFAVVAREEHLTRAADRLGVPQPTLSRSIARLEADLGIPLFTRPGRSIRLTRHGRQLLEAAEPALAALAGTLERMSTEADPLSGRVALGFLHTLGGEAVPRLLKDFRVRHPLIRFALVQDGGHALLARLRAGDIDLCLTAPPPQSPDIRSRPLDEQRIDLFVPAGHRLAARAQAGIALAEAAGEDFIVMEPGYGLRAITDDLFRAAGFEPRVTFEGEEADTARGLVSAGLGVSLLPATAASLADRSVTAVRVTAPKAARTVAIAWPADRPLTAPAAAFRDFALTYAGRLPRLRSRLARSGGRDGGA